MAEAEGKKLTELRVIDLKTELERRGLDKTGNKAALLDRLSKAIKDEGHDPDEFLIVPLVGQSKPTIKKPIETHAPIIDHNIDPDPPKEIIINDIVEVEKPTSNFDEKVESTENTDEIVIHDDTEPEKKESEDVDIEGIDNDDKIDSIDNINNDDNIDVMDHVDDLDNMDSTDNFDPDNTEEPEISINAQPEELEMECQEPEQEPAVTTTSEEPISEKKSFIHSEESSNVSAIETNGIDNEDSINLTIGEDEENLLVEETESNDRLKDGGVKKSSEESNESADNDSSSKKGDSKGSGRAESSVSNKERTPSSPSGSSAAGGKSKPDGDGNKSGDLASKSQKKDDKDKPSASITSTSRNLWVSGLSSTTRATDLKQVFSKYGKVIGAKVVTNAKTPGARCYGYVTMSTSDDAEKCIQHLHRTELHGRVISVEKAKGDSAQNQRKREIVAKTDKKDEKENSKDSEVKTTEMKDDEKKIEESSKDSDKKDSDENSREKRAASLENKDEGSIKDCDTRSQKSTSRKSDKEGKSRESSREDKKRSWDSKTRPSRSLSRERHRKDNVLSFAKIKEERERQRLREKERLIREEKRRRREDMERKREIDREAARLEREREKLRMERERIEQEKAELLRLERERQKLEREKLERERLELKRQQLRLEETSRRPPPPSAMKRSDSDRREPRDAYEPERKRIAPDHTARRHEVPERERHVERREPPLRYDARSKDTVMQKGFKRTEFGSRGGRDDQYSDSRGGREVVVRKDSRPNHTIDHRPVKERYERPSGFGRDREVHRTDDHRSSRDDRYDTKPNPRGDRYVESGRPTGWQSGPPSKPFNSMNNRNEHTGWNSRPSDSRVNTNNRWNNSNNMSGNMGHPRSNTYNSGPQQSYGMSQGNSGSYNRFEPYKGSMHNVRKY